MTPAPKDKDGVVYENLSPRDREKFDASRFKEIDNLLKMGALSVMTLKESKRYRVYFPEYIIPSNMLDKWKLQDDGSMLAKSRNVLIGWKDPMIYQLERRAPTPTQEAIMVLLQWLASFRAAGMISDLTNAFGQSRKTNRETPLATELPRGLNTHRYQRDVC